MAKKKKTPLLDKALDTTVDKRIIFGKEGQGGTKFRGTIMPLIDTSEKFPGCPPSLEYIKIPIVGSRTPEQLSADISDLLCWFQGVEYATSEEKSYKLEMARNGINAIRDIHHYIKNPLK